MRGLHLLLFFMWLCSFTLKVMALNTTLLRALFTQTEEWGRENNPTLISEALLANFKNLLHNIDIFVLYIFLP